MDEKLHLRNSFVQACLSQCYSSFIVHPLTQILVLAFFLALTCVAGWAASQAEINFSLDYFVNEDHFLNRYI